MTAEPTNAERAAVDDFLEECGVVPVDRHPHIAHGGFHEAARLRTWLLPALLAVQSRIGWVGEGALNHVCARLRVPPAEAYGVATFYALIATAPRPGRMAHICDDLACRSVGGDAILGDLSDRPDAGPSPCLGQCDRGPAALIQRASETDIVITSASTADVTAALAGAVPGSVASGHPPLGGPQETRRLLRRVGVADPNSIDDYRSHGGYRALPRALEMGAPAVIDAVQASNLRGRGGAAFPMGVKWAAVAGSPVAERYVVCNADESEPGTFKDRVILEGDPFAVVEALTIAGLTVGAARGYVYIRGEYPLAAQRLERALDAARETGMLGADIAGSGRGFDIEIRVGGGAYICGEETAIFQSIEGFRGEPRQKPPFPTEVGLFGKPTVVNNVETLVNVLAIVEGGVDAFTSFGTDESTGTKLFCLSGDVAAPGTYEVSFGASTNDLLALAGTSPGDVRAVLLGGAAGSFITGETFDVPLTFEDTRAAGITVGSGVVMAFAHGTDFDGVVRRIAAFFRDESCGQCVPCRVGTVRQEEALHRITLKPGGPSPVDLSLLTEIDDVMKSASICALGHTAGSAAQSAIRLGLLTGVSP